MKGLSANFLCSLLGNALSSLLQEFVNVCLPFPLTLEFCSLFTKNRVLYLMLKHVFYHALLEILFNIFVLESHFLRVNFHNGLMHHLLHLVIPQLLIGYFVSVHGWASFCAVAKIGLFPFNKLLVFSFDKLFQRGRCYLHEVRFAIVKDLIVDLDLLIHVVQFVKELVLYSIF